MQAGVITSVRFSFAFAPEMSEIGFFINHGLIESVLVSNFIGPIWLRSTSVTAAQNRAKVSRSCHRSLCLYRCLLPVWGRYSEAAQAAFVRTFGDVMQWRSRSLAGWGAVDCGIVPIRGNADAATDCALRAFASHKPFRVRYGLQTYDTVMAAGVVASPDGQVHELIFWGGSPTEAQMFSVNVSP
jgi:hypothetical protein